MNGKQFNFYYSPQQLMAIDDYLHKKGFVILDSPSKDKVFPVLTSVSELSETGSYIKYLCRKEFPESLEIDFIPTQNYYLIDPIKSNVIEFIQPFFDEKLQKEKPGRIYFVKNYYNEQDELIEKPAEFIKFAEALMRKVKAIGKPPKKRVAKQK